MNNDNKPYIVVNKVCKGFGHGKNRSEVINKISFEVFKGEFVSIMGPSGCGKSTLLYLVGGLDRPDCGKIEVGAQNINALNDNLKSSFRRKNIGFIFQFYNLVANLSVEENILLPVIMEGGSISSYQTKLDEILLLTDMESKRKAYPNELSGGQQQRVAIARALIMNPELILADEPTGNLDQNSALDVISLFQRINEEYGTTILQVTHSKEMASYSSRILNMRDGTIQDFTLIDYSE